MAHELTLRFGCLAPTLQEQLSGYALDEHDLEHFESDRMAIARLRVRGVINDPECKSAERRLLKQITKAILAGKAQP